MNSTKASLQHYLFDIGGVLINFSIPLLVKNLSEKSGLPQEALKELFRDDCVRRVESGKISGSDFFRQQVKPLLPGWSYDDWIASWMDIYTLNEPGMDLLRELKRKDSPVYLLSNLAEFNTLAIERKFSGFFDEPDHSFFSYKLGLCKPDVEIYHAVAERLKVKISSFIFFDDTLKNIEGADKAGMKGMLFSNERLKEIRSRLT